MANNILNNALQNSLTNYGQRINGTQKQNGFFGPLPTPNGKVATELSIGVNFDGKDTLIPALVPTLNTDEVNHLLSGGKLTPEILNKAVSFAKQRISSNKNPFASNEEIPYGIALPGNGSEKSNDWQANQFMMSKAASAAGLPSFLPTQDNSASRLRLTDAISRAISSGQPTPHFIGLPNEPLGDRGVTMDIESLVKSLEREQAQAILNNNKNALDKIRKEKAFWENEAASGMSDAQWRSQTGEPSPTYTK